MSTTHPLFRQPKPLDSVLHRNVLFKSSQPYHFAAQQMLSPIVAGEVSRVAREYAIVFGGTASSLPLALLGTEQGQNAYVRPSGHWVARYLPAHLRRYPFVLSEPAATDSAADVAAGANRFVLVDADAPHLDAENGQRLFEPDGQPAETLLHVQRVLVALERDSARTLELVGQIHAAGLLVERVIEVRPRSGQPVGLQGLRVVDAARLDALAPEALHALQQSGALHLVHAHLISLTNLLDGPLVQADAQAGQAMAANGSAGSDGNAGNTGSTGSISFEGIDWSKF